MCNLIHKISFPWPLEIQIIVCKTNLLRFFSSKKACIIVFYECVRAKVVLTFTIAANSSIASSLFSFPLFGPIMCGTVAGCGGAFLPLNKGLDPISTNGMNPPMITAFVGSTMLHLFLNTGMSEGVIDAKEKAHLHLALLFIATGIVSGLNLGAVKVKKE